MLFIVLIINLVNGQHSFLRNVLGLFYVKIHVSYLLAYKLIHI